MSNYEFFIYKNCILNFQIINIIKKTLNSNRNKYRRQIKKLL